MTRRPLIAALALLASLATLPAQAALGSRMASQAEPRPAAATARADALIGGPSATPVAAQVPARRQARIAVSSMVETTEAEPVQDAPAATGPVRVDRI